jgi:hypothetical protein
VGDFETLKKTSYAWQKGARELIGAANVLLNAYERTIASTCVETPPFEPNEQSLWRPMMVLYALAAENLLKAIIIARGEDPAPSGKLVEWFRTHKLVEHAKRARLSFIPRPGLLETLREFIESGKYPIGTNPKSGLRTNQFIYPNYPDTVYDLLTKLEDDLRVILPDKTFPATDLRNMCRHSSKS